MASESYYFSHDVSPTEDPKMVPLLEIYGGMGYGTYWHLVELLHREGGTLPLKEYLFSAVANKMKWDPDSVKNFVVFCVYNVELFSSDDSVFWSNRVYRNMEDRTLSHNKKVEAGRAGGIKSGQSRRSKQNEALLQANEASVEANEANEAKERKGKERKD